MAGESVIRLSVINDASPKLKAVDRDAKKLSKTVKNSNGVLNQQNRSLKSVALGWMGVGKGAKAAVPGITMAGAAMNKALGFILPYVAAGAALIKVFETIAKQDFAEAKFETLGGNSEKLTSNLRRLSAELRNQQSIVDLTSASYDVASAGFTDAGDAAKILKAASFGATGGFTDINTAAGATVKVLNAYGLGAEDAAFLMDQFAQTQADGIITIGDYSRNIGKVATTAALLKVPLSEVNAIIAQSTAAGTQTETAFSGLNAALSKISSGEIGKRLGADINASTLASEGLAGTLEKLSKFSAAELQQAFGIEAFKGLQVAIKDLDKFNELLENQVKAQGKAERESLRAEDTLQKQFERLGKSVTNLFAEGTFLGDLLKITIQGIAGTVEALGAGIKFLVMLFKGGWAIVEGFAKSIGLIKENTEDMLGPMQSLTKWWFKNIASMEDAQQSLIKSGQETGQRLAAVWDLLKHKITKVVTIISEAWTNFYENNLAGSVDRLKQIGEMLSKALGGALMRMLNGIKDLWDKWIADIKSKVDWFLNLPGIRQIAGFTKDQMDQFQNTWKNSVTVTGEVGEEGTDGKKQNEKDTTEELKKQLELTKYLNEGFKRVGETISHSLKDGIKGLIKGTQTLGEMLSNIAMKVSDMLLDIAISGIFKKWGFPGFASGGIPPVGKPAIVGEEGPELFVPRQAGRIIPNDKLGGGGSVNVSVHVDASGSSAEGDEEQATQLGNMLGAAIQAELVRQQRPGGLLAT